MKKVILLVLIFSAFGTFGSIDNTKRYKIFVNDRQIPGIFSSDHFGRLTVPMPPNATISPKAEISSSVPLPTIPGGDIPLSVESWSLYR